jgi:hypothetical protein
MTRTEQIAKATHDIVRAFQKGSQQTFSPIWENTNDEEKQDMICNVFLVRGDPYITPKEIHAEWLKKKKEDGWVYAGNKITRLKRHPCLLNWNMIGREEQAKYFIISTIIKSILSMEPIK